MNSYKVLNKQNYTSGDFAIVPIRYQDRMDIMKWRNEQIFHLRQSEPLTKKQQENYFSKVVAKLFDEEKPGQILFSYLKGDTCLGYGGLVHINWVDKNAELSFITNTAIKNKDYELHMSTFLGLITRVAFDELCFHKIFTYAFDVRPHIYPILEKNGFSKEAILKQHCLFENVFKDVIIHAKFNSINKR